jgi:hypothetical protein
MTTKRQLYERRADLLRAMVKGNTVSSAYKALQTNDPQAIKYGRLTEKMLLNDWARRKEWEPIVLQLSDGSLLHEIIAGMKETMPQAWAIYSQSMATKNVRGMPIKPNLPVALGALNTLQAGYARLLSALQDSGIVEKAALKIAATIEKQVDLIGLSEDERKILVEAARIVDQKSSTS